VIYWLFADFFSSNRPQYYYAFIFYFLSFNFDPSSKSIFFTMFNLSSNVRDEFPSALDIYFFRGKGSMFMEEVIAVTASLGNVKWIGNCSEIFRFVLWLCGKVKQVIK